MRSINFRLLTSSIFRGLNLALQVGVGFFMLPFLVSSLGDQVYGYWALIASVLGYYYYLDFGLLIAVQRQFAFHIDDGKDQINCIFNTSLLIYFGISFITIFVTTAICVIVIYCNYNVQLSVSRKFICIILALIGTSAAISFPVKPFQGLLSAMIRHDMVNVASMVKFIFTSCGVLIVVGRGYGVMEMLVVTIIGNIVEHLLMITFSVIACPFLRIIPSVFSRDIMGKLFSYGSKSFFSQVAEVLGAKGGEFVIAFLISPAVLTHYIVGRRLVEYFSQIVQQLVGVITPRFSTLDGKGDSDGIRKMFAASLCVSASLSMYIGGLIILLGRDFILLWMGGGFFDSYIVLIILALGATINLSLFPNSCLVYGTANHQIFTILNPVESVLNILLIFILINIGGIYGVAIALTVTSIFFRLIFLPIYICRKFDITCKKYYLHFLLPTVFKMIIFHFLCSLFFCRYVHIGGYFDLFIFSFVHVFLFVVYFVCLILPIEFRQYILYQFNAYRKKIFF